MARDPKLEVAAVNIRIPEDAHRNYVALIKEIYDMKRGVRVHGDTYVAISHFEEKLKVGVLSKYTEIDIDGDWFNLEDFDAASPEELNEINIPENLRPNLSQFWFLLDEELHVVAFSSYSESRALSARSVEKFFRGSVQQSNIVEQFGAVEVDVVKSYSEVDRILNLPKLRELVITIGRPNSDDIGDDLASIIEARLAAQNADEYEESLKTKSNNGLKPDDQTRKLAFVAAENGHVRAKSVVNGVMTPSDTDDMPLTEVEKYKPDESERVLFFKVAKRIFDRIRAARESLRG